MKIKSVALCRPHPQSAPSPLLAVTPVPQAPGRTTRWRPRGQPQDQPPTLQLPPTPLSVVTHRLGQQAGGKWAQGSSQVARNHSSKPHVSKGKQRRKLVSLFNSFSRASWWLEHIYRTWPLQSCLWFSVL